MTADIFDQFEYKSNDASSNQGDVFDQFNPENSGDSPYEVYERYYKAPEYSPQELENMSIREQMQYNEALQRERDYLSSKGISKGFLSGLTLGASENIDALKPQEQELGTGFGEMLGAAAPITGASKIVGAGIKQLPKVLKPLQNLMHTFGTGSLYETGKQAVKKAYGEEVDLSQIPKTGRDFLILDRLLRYGGKGLKKLIDKFQEIPVEAQSQILEQGIIPENISKSQYEVAEKMLNEINNLPDVPLDVPPPGATPSKPITGKRITKPQDVGLRPTPQKKTPDYLDEVGDIFSKEKFYNTTEGGKAYKKEIMDIDRDVYKGVNELYKKSRELNSNISDIHPDLVENLSSKIADLEAIPEPSDVQRRVVKTAKSLLKELSDIDVEGNITGYKPINNQVLIDQIQSLRQIIDYDFAHGNTKNIFKPIINDIQESVLKTAQKSNIPEAAESFNDARTAYRTWAEAFDNDYVRPFRDRSNQDYSKLFKSALDLDEHNMLKKILSVTETGQKLSNASTREIVEKNLSKFFDNPRKTNPKDFDKALRELEAVIDENQVKEIKSLFRDAVRRPKFKAKPSPRKKTPEKILKEKYKSTKPEDILKKMNTRSGIREIRKDFPKPMYDKLSKQKLRSILRGENIESDAIGNDLYKLLNKEKNYELFSEILGEESTEALRLRAKEIGEKNLKSEIRKKSIGKAVKKIALLKSFDTIHKLL